VAAVVGAARGSPIAALGVVSLAGVADLRRAAELELSQGVVRELLGGGPDRVPERYAAASPIELLPLGVRQVLVHGVDDAIVPIEIADSYCARARALGDPVDLIRLPDTGHFELIDPQARVFPTVLAAVRSVVDR
jgi:dipeptidyl aminopeptidase/acylaminoacyl peptidase